MKLRARTGEECFRGRRIIQMKLRARTGESFLGIVSFKTSNLF